jgi:hypothetical protein
LGSRPAPHSEGWTPNRRRGIHATNSRAISLSRCSATCRCPPGPRTGAAPRPASAEP